MKNLIAKKVFCFTGELEHFNRREDAWNEVIQHGGKVTDVLNKICNYLVIGAKGSQKYFSNTGGKKRQKAEEWRSKGHPIKIISENTFMTILENEGEQIKECDDAMEKIEHIRKHKTQINDTILNCTNGNKISCSEGYDVPKPNIGQLFRLTYTTGVSQEEENYIREKIAEIKEQFESSGGKIFYESYPVNWGAGVILMQQDDGIIKTINHIKEYGVDINLKVIKKIDKECLSDVNDTISFWKNIFTQKIQIDGNLSIRVWNEDYGWAKFWLRKLK